MPNLAGVLKGEIRRLARKEVRASVKPLRKLVTALRRRIAEQRRLMAEMERAAKRSIASGRKAADAASEDLQIRFSPQWVKAHRKKLGMSRRVYAKLVGVSAQSIFGWETGRTRPRRRALESWRRMRSMGKRELKALPGMTKPGRRGRRAEGAVRRGRAEAGAGRGRILAARASRRRPVSGRRRAAKKK